MGIVIVVLKGRVTSKLSASNFPWVTRAVIYTEATADDQLKRDKQIASTFVIADRLMFTSNTRDSISVATDPFPGSGTKVFMEAMSWEWRTKSPRVPATANIETRSEWFVVGSMAKTKARKTK